MRRYPAEAVVFEVTKPSEVDGWWHAFVVGEHVAGAGPCDGAAGIDVWGHSTVDGVGWIHQVLCPAQLRPLTRAARDMLAMVRR
jgi:hypothetical protein